MIKFLSFKDKPIAGDSLDYLIPKDGEFTWIFLIAPSEEEVERICKDFSLERTHFGQYAKASYSKQYETNPLEFVLVDYFLDSKNNIQHSRLLFIAGQNYLITAIPNKSEYHIKLFEEVVDDFKQFTNKTLGHLLYEFLSEDIEDNYEVLQISDEMVRKFETTILEQKEINLQQIIISKRELSKMNKRFWSASKIIFLLRKGIAPTFITPEVQKLLDDVYDSLHHQMNIIQDQKEALTDILRLYETISTNKQAKASTELNEIVKKLTAITLILMIPTLIATVYGMNFKNMPEIYWDYGYFVALGAMTILTIGAAIIARKNKWL